MVWTFFILLFLLAFIVILAVQRLDGPASKTGTPSSILWIHPTVLQALPQEKIPFNKRRLNRKRQPQAILDPQLLEVSTWDWERIPGSIPPERYQKLHPNHWDTLENQLLETVGCFILRSPCWPICCSELSVLVYSQGKGISLHHLESEHGPLDQAFLENELKTWGGPKAKLEEYFVEGWSSILAQIRAGTHSGQGINFFRCENCNRLYIGSCSP